MPPPLKFDYSFERNCFVIVPKGFEKVGNSRKALIILMQTEHQLTCFEASLKIDDSLGVHVHAQTD